MSDDGGYKEWQMQQTIDALTAVAEQLREHHKLAVEQWTLEAQRVKELEDNVHELRAENEALRKLADDLYLIMPGQFGHGDISREQRTKADYMKLRGEEEK